MKTRFQGPDERDGEEGMEMHTRPRRRRQSLFSHSDDDNASLMRQDGGRRTMLKV